ncbi:MAG: anaerobic carbon-monoxide dehydrogenase catalytic subunit [Solidesulfovibrio sp.]|uniref:anaerobic carbon-monoxide dehydrogenase catalytic subunit n=1 Tax=Solidesulfovibrio sp. TaxID=2910990 RepID=UPI002B202B8D|nr:anaerobic carbon-monoxide dehydrogenase catalytic subunit [Solidesulfovibrio sp.]MEA4856098.1 anaerobic carbon-monoxide dehydrogenase catalytic subunit [Solidesulfovibrio sp.]
MAKQDLSAYSICEDAQAMIAKAGKDGVETVWDRLKAQQPQCGFCELGLSCRNCVMGPCRIDPFGDGPQRGICGADADVIVARNFGRMVAAGAASHSDHGRDLVETLLAIGEGTTTDYAIRDEAKLRRIAEEVGLDVAGKDTKAVALALAEQFYGDFGSRRGSVSFIDRVPAKRRELWEKLDITPRGIDRDVVEMMHRTHMGVDNDAVNICLHAARLSLADGWAGSMIATELSDVIFGTPTPRPSKVNLGVLKEDHVNILVHGHSPIVSEMILAAVRDPALVAKAKAAGAAGINLAGLCCTGNELLMRQGIPMAGNHLMTELALVTGAVEVIVVDYQCIMPSLVTVAGCYHSRIVSTSPKAKFTGATHIAFDVHNAKQKALEVVELAIERYKERDQSRVDIPVEPVDIVSGFSNEAVLAALGGTAAPLIEAIKAGKIRGAVGIVGCNNPKVKHDYQNVNLIRECIKRDLLVLVTGCVTVSAGKQGLLVPGAADMAGPGLSEVCKALGIPPVLHVGSCVDNSRIMQLCGMLATALGVDIADLPVAAAAPEWYSEKAATIGLYAVASGIFTVLGVEPPILGSKLVTDLAVSGLEGVVGASFAVEGDPVKAADLIDARIRTKRQALGLKP